LVPDGVVEAPATNDDTDDIFLVRHDGPVTTGGHEVIWFADDIVQVFANVIDWMLAMRSSVATLRERKTKEASASIQMLPLGR